MHYRTHALVCREDLFKDMMSEREDVAAKRNKCLGAQQAFREALAALEALPQQLTALTGRTVSQALPTDAAAWSEPAPIAQSSTALPGKPTPLDPSCILCASLSCLCDTRSPGEL